MRVVAALPDYPPSSRVGAWLATHQQLAHLVTRGHEVTVFPVHGRLFAPYQFDGVNVHPFMRGADLDRAIRDTDVVVTHLGDNGAGARFARKHDRPSVRFGHGHIPNPVVLDGAALVVFNSTNLAESVQCSAPSIVCHPVVRADHVRTTPGDRVTLVNLSEAKGGELFWRLVRCLPHREFLAVRGGWGIQYVDRAVNVRLIRTTQNMRDDVYAKTKVLLMPSERETWGMTAIEAIASGIPVIAHPTPGLVESLGDAGVFVDRADGHGWLTQIERLHDPVEWATASHRALTRSNQLDPSQDLDRFATNIERLV